MALGTCRHCEAGGIPTDAPICRSCGGWRPNPGFFTRAGVVMTRLIAVVMLVVGLALSALILLLALGEIGIGALVFLLPVGSLALGGASMLLRSLIRPYGREYGEQ